MLFHIDPLRLWVHKVLPVVYDDSLSYYEVLAKVTKKLNEVIDLTEEQNQFIQEFSDNLTNAINSWEDGMEREWSSYKSDLNNEWGAFQRNTEQYIENWKNMAENDIEDAIAAGINQFVSYFSGLTQTAVDAAEEAMRAAETAAQDAVDAVMPTLESEFDERYAWKTAVGSPLVATTAAGMTDTTKVYVYAGSETGYVNGDWYYYDGTAWQDGGVYNSAAVVTDPTLSESGVPADAKAAGDEIADLKSAIDEIPEEPIKNLFDPQGLLDAGWTVSDGVYSGTPKALVTKWDAVYPLNHYTFKAGVRYTISLYANRDTSADGTGMVVAFTYTDASTKSVLYMPNSATTSTAFTLTSKSAHDVASIYFAFSSLGDATWHIKDVMLVEGTTAQDYEPFDLTAVDSVARGNASSLISQVTALSDSVSHVVTLPRGTNPLYVPQGATIKITNNSATTNGSATAYDTNGTEIEQISANIRQGTSVLYTAPQNVGSIRFYSTDTSATATVTFMDTLDERVNTLESYHANPIPSYFQTAIETATTTVKNRMMGVGKEGDTFVFITDIHWENNRKHSPALIKYLIDHLNINKIICGGDLITQGEREAMSNDMLECIKAFTFPDVMLPTVFGNHDSNWNNYGTQRQDPTRRFDINAVYSLICKQAEPYVTFMTDYDCSFYFDNKNCATRYICLDTGEDDSNYRYFTAFDELADALNNTPSGYNIVIIAHIVTYGVFKTYVEPMLDAYNAKTTYEYDGTTYDFTSANGHVVIGIGGHTHEDSDHTTTGGIPIVVVTCDLFNADSTEGTVTEQAFDVVTLDYANDTAYFDRVGKGVSRTFTLG